MPDESAGQLEARIERMTSAAYRRVAEAPPGDATASVEERLAEAEKRAEVALRLAKAGLFASFRLMGVGTPGGISVDDYFDELERHAGQSYS